MSKNFGKPTVSTIHLFTTLCGLLLGVNQTAYGATVTFEQASAGALSTYTESGFKTSVISGPWVAIESFGNPAPFIQFVNEAGQNPLVATVQITNDDSAFTFNSVDLYSSVTPIPYEITGLLDSTEVFSFAGTIPNTFGNFETVVNSNSNDLLIDSMTISLTNPAPTCCSNPMGLDNIDVTATSTTSVPEPNSSLLFWLGLSVFTWLLRQEKRLI